MGKITINEMHNSLFDYAQAVSDENLMTENKTIVDAINEIYGKRLIADSIGEPLNNTDTFTKMSNDINNLLSTFKTNIMNAGIAVESSDKFKQLIDKIATMVEEGSNKGIQYTSGVSTVSVPGEATTVTIPFNETLNYIPNIVFVRVKYYQGSSVYFDGWLSNNQPLSLNVSGYGIAKLTVDNVTEEQLRVDVYTGNTNYLFLNTSSSSKNIDFSWYAIGVGEEDTTLRDSLASILQEEGVSVTEEDDMASLISKVDEEFDNRITMKTGTLDYTNGLVGEYNNGKIIITHNLGTIPSYIVCRTSEMDYMPNDSSVGRSFTGSLCLTIDNSSYVTGNGNRATLSITDITENTFTVLTTMETSGRLSGWIEEWIVMK